MNEAKIRALIVDDEPLARSMVRRMLDGHADIELIGECESGEEAVAAIQTLQPDLVFLDVQMPGRDGFAVIEALAAARLPHIIFITAYDQYAVRAFDVHALDYLLKPFDRERFEQSLQRAVRQIKAEQSGELNERIFALLAERQPAATYLERFIIKGDGRVFFLKAEEIEWVEAEGNYVVLHAGGKRHLFREAISNLETRLDPRRFQRIGRSAIVNLDCIRELQPWFRGDYKIILHNGTELKLSHRFRDKLNKHLGGSL
jgi:two-component system, LytTR family, response regulator